MFSQVSGHKDYAKQLPTILKVVGIRTKEDVVIGQVPPHKLFPRGESCDSFTSSEEEGEGDGEGTGKGGGKKEGEEFSELSQEPHNDDSESLGLVFDVKIKDDVENQDYNNGAGKEDILFVPNEEKNAVIHVRNARNSGTSTEGSKDDGQTESVCKEDACKEEEKGNTSDRLVLDTSETDSLDRENSDTLGSKEDNGSGVPENNEMGGSILHVIDNDRWINDSNSLGSEENWLGNSEDDTSVHSQLSKAGQISGGDSETILDTSLISHSSDNGFFFGFSPWMLQEKIF